MDALEVSYPVLLLLVITAVVLDFRCFRISNRLILAGYALAAALRFAQGGWQELLPVLRNISFPVIVLFPIYRMRAIGAGDVKLFSMIGGFVNFTVLVRSMVFSFVFGAAISLGVMLYYGTLFQGLYDAGSYIWGLMGGKWTEYRPSGDKKRHVIHFSVAILLGTVAALVWGRLR